jgi:hypothetical protein
MRKYWAVIPVLVALLAGCASQQRADKALKETEAAITAQHADAIRFAPAAFNAVVESYKAARKAYDEKDWAAAIKAAADASAKARQLPPAIAEGRAKAVEQWPARRDSTSAMVSALAARLAEWTRTRRYPTGVTAAQVRQMQQAVDSLGTGLNQAQQAFKAGDVAGAIHALERIQQRTVQLVRESGAAPRNPHGASVGPGT